MSHSSIRNDSWDGCGPLGPISGLPRAAFFEACAVEDARSVVWRFGGMEEGDMAAWEEGDIAAHVEA